MNWGFFVTRARTLSAQSKGQSLPGEVSIWEAENSPHWPNSANEGIIESYSDFICQEFLRDSRVTRRRNSRKRGITMSCLDAAKTRRGWKLGEKSATNLWRVFDESECRLDMSMVNVPSSLSNDGIAVSNLARVLLVRILQLLFWEMTIT